MKTRRSVLSTAGALVAASSGCTSIGGTSSIGGTGAVDVVIHNETRTERVIHFDISGERVIDEEYTTPVRIAADRVHRYDTIVQENDEYDVSVNVEGGASRTYTWEDIETALHIFVDNMRYEGEKRVNVLFAKDVTERTDPE